MSNGDEFTAGTVPTNAESVFTVEIVSVNSSGIVRFVSIEADSEYYAGLSRFYSLEHATSLLETAWQSVPGFTNIPATGGILEYTDSLLPDNRRFFKATTHLE